MFDLQIVLVTLLLLVVWAAALAFLFNVGPGKVHRGVSCPESHKRASLVVLYKEPIWGRLEPSDVVSCSLQQGGAVACGKECLAHL